MPLLNYTTKISAEKTISEVSTLLVRMGARRMMTTFDDDGDATGIAFSIPTIRGDRGYVLPVDVEAVQKVLSGQRLEPRFQTAEQAGRVAWRILKDWIEAQLAIIETEMVDVEQVMLPYMHMDGRTVYDVYLDGQLDQLGQLGQLAIEGPKENR